MSVPTYYEHFKFMITPAQEGSYISQKHSPNAKYLAEYNQISCSHIQCTQKGKDTQVKNILEQSMRLCAVTPSRKCQQECLASVPIKNPECTSGSDR